MIAGRSEGGTFMSRSVRWWCCCACTIALCATLPRTAAAQETRAGIITQAQAAKAADLKPYEPGKAERIAADLQKRLLGTPDGFYPWFESVYSGGGFTLGSGYRRFTGDRTYVDARGLYSAKSYKLGEIAADSLGLANGHLDLRAVSGWRDATRVAFYGVGPDTPIEAHSNFQFQQA